MFHWCYLALNSLYCFTVLVFALYHFNNNNLIIIYSANLFWRNRKWDGALLSYRSTRELEEEERSFRNCTSRVFFQFTSPSYSNSIGHNYWVLYFFCIFLSIMILRQVFNFVHNLQRCLSICVHVLCSSCHRACGIYSILWSIRALVIS